MDAKHTPGPWRIGDLGLTVFGAKSDQPAPVTIATLPAATPRVDLGQRNANACLIAAAPELLEACRDLLSAFRKMGSQQQYDTFSAELHDAETAIAKAEGKS